MKHILFYALLYFMFTNISFAQYDFIKDNDSVSNKDLIDMLNFSGIGIMYFDIDSLDQNYQLYVIADEYAGKDNFLKSDTLYNREIAYYVPNGTDWSIAYPDKIRLLTKIENDSYGKISYMLTVGKVSKNGDITISEKYSRKHYFLKFQKLPLEIGKKIPFLFFGSEWDDIINGKKVSRFCSQHILSPDLTDEAIQFVPHFFVISYVLKPTN